MEPTNHLPNPTTNYYTSIDRATTPTTTKELPRKRKQKTNKHLIQPKSLRQSHTPVPKALNESGYTYKLKYNPQPIQTPRRNRKRNRQKNITWYNSPWNSSVKTNLGKKFLHIVDKCFPKKHPLYNIFNRHMLKLSYMYSCMPSMKSIILLHNKTVLSDYNTTPMQQANKQCNCRTKDECPLQGKCLETNVVYMYQAIITSNTESYIRLATNCKERFRNHTSFRHTNKRNSTELSKHVWKLKDAKKAVNIPL